MSATLDEIADLRRANAELQQRLDEALAREAATAEVLQVINSSPGDLTPVFDAMLTNELRLCEAALGQLWAYHGDCCFEVVASRGVPAKYAEFMRGRQRFGPGTAHARIVAGEGIVHISDLADEVYRAGDPHRTATVELGGLRSLLGVALRQGEKLLGVLMIYRQEARVFSAKQISLLQGFAAQAVVAMENARLITETREALEQQIATAEILQVINSSPGDLRPVFDAILEKAHSLCGVAYGSLQLYDGEKFRAVAVHGLPETLADRLRQGYSPGPDNPVTRLLEGRPFTHTLDLAEIDDPVTLSVVELVGTRTLLCVALRRNEKILGLIAAVRLEVRPFSDKEIALLESFAAQAVIAMENARLLTETRVALEQQTATAEVLQVINSSPGDLGPVFDAMLDKAIRLCETSFGILWTYDSEQFTPVLVHGPAAFVEFYRDQRRLPPVPGSALARHVSGEDLIQIADIANDALYKDGNSRRRAYVELGGARTAISVPLRKDGTLLGAIQVYRQEVRSFSEKQIGLLQNFAAQAVIAMENARLITETREALEQQTATAEVLQVINSSPGELAPVFDAMLEKALRLCGGSFGELRTYDGERFRLAATHGVPTAYVQYYSRNDAGVYGPGTGPARILTGERLVHIPDLIATEPYQRGDPDRVALVDLGGARAYVLVPLLKDGAVLGYVMIYRMEVGSFSEKQITLLQNFAAQAVIAIENARLLDEIRQRQAELRTTFDNMGDGVVMFDETLHLAAWNQNFQQILDLPDFLLAERPTYTEYLRILADRGEFGTHDVEAELNRRLEHTDKEFRAERTRPDGRVIEVRRNAVPGGGFVLIYSNITERKRSEAEIRAARDAAEAAYRDLKAAQASLIQAEKMASLGQLTAGIAHEIKNPLNFVNNFADLSVELLDELKETATPAITALDDEKRAEIDESIELLTGNLAKIAEHGRRADNIVKSMLEHSRGSSGDRRTVDLNGLIDEALNLAYHGGRAQDQSFNVTLERNYAAAMAPIELVPQDITRVCLNLFGNGFYAATKRQRERGDANFKPTLKVSTRDLGNAVEVRIRDNGTGIPAEIKDKLFQPFVTTKPTGEGTGLGLSISYDIVTQQHGGSIEVYSEAGEFTEFTVRLPRSHRATVVEAAS
jgi:GAF domain-containing protein/nitrogen-specific signal transduction histidine kinase